MSFINIHEYHFQVGNTVAKMADQTTDTTDVCTIAIEVKHGPKSLINIISTFEMKMTLSEVFDVVSKDLHEVLVQVQVSSKGEGPWRDVPPSEKRSSLPDFQIWYIRFWVRQKFHLEHCKIKADFTLMCCWCIFPCCESVLYAKCWTTLHF